MKPDPNMATIVRNPALDSTAMPDRAAPLVHPLASCAPYTKQTPPKNAISNLLLFVMRGDFSIFHFSLPEMAPEINPPTIIPNTSNTSQFLIGF